MSGNITEGFRTTQLDGDLSLGRNLHLGGGVTAQGNSHFKGKVKVDGVLEADSIENTSKGLFASVDDLAAAYPEPKAGWWALVGDNLPAAMYVVANGAWVASGGNGGDISVELDNYVTKSEVVATHTAIMNEVRTRAFINLNFLAKKEFSNFSEALTWLVDNIEDLDLINNGAIMTFGQADGVWKNYRLINFNSFVEEESWEEVSVNDSLESASTTSALSANQGKILNDKIIPKTFINANVLLNYPDEMSLDSVTTLLEDEGYNSKQWFRHGTVVTFLSAEGWKNYRFLSDAPESDIQNGNMWEEVLSSGNSAGVPTVDSLLGLMRLKPHCKKVNNSYYMDSDTFGIVEVTHPIFELYSKWERFPLENVQVCLMRYVKRVGKKTAKNKKGWVKCFEKDLGSKEDWNGTIPDAGFEPDIDGAIVRFKLYDMLEFIKQNYLCVEGNLRSDLKGNTLTDVLYEGFAAWFGNNIKDIPNNARQRAHFGIALRCDNPDFPTESTNPDTTRYSGVSRYIYSDVFDIVVDVRQFVVGKIGCSFLG